MFARGTAMFVLIGMLAVVVPALGQDGPKAAHDVLIEAPKVLAPESRASVRVVVYESKGLNKVAAVKDASVEIALVDAKSASRALYSGRTGAAGSADAAFNVPAAEDGDYTLVVTTKSAAGEHVAKQPVRVKRDFKILLVTDKPLYQPGQEIRIRALALDEMTLKALGGQSLQFEVEDAKGNKVFKKAEKTNEFGVTSADFQLADEVLMGDYKITAQLAGTKAEKSVTVKRYVLPKFKVEVKTDKKFYLPKEKVKATVQVDYFFGKPVAGGEVIVKASTFDVQFREFAQAKTKTDAKGAGEFEIVLPEYFVGSPLDKGNAFASIEIQVMDTAEHLETVTKTVPVANQAILVGAVPESGKLVPGLENVVYVLASSPDGSPVEADVTLKLGKTETTGKTNPSGFAALRVTPAEGDLVSDGRGGAAAQAEVTAKDKTGAEAKRAVQLSSEYGKDQLLVRLDKAIYNAGDRITLDAFATFAKTDLYVDVVRRGQTVLGTVAEIEKGRSSVTIPVTPDLFGTLEVHGYAFLGTGEIVRDTKVIFVNPASELAIDVKADKASYRPGDEALIQFKVTDRGGSGVTSALGVIVVDESVYALQDMQPGLEKIYFMLEKELMAPKIEIKWGGSIPGMIEDRVKREETAEARKQQAAIVLLAPVSLPDRHATINTMASRVAMMQQQVVNLYWGLHNYIVNQRNPFWQVGTGGRREWKKTLLDEMVEKKAIQADQLKDPWGNKVALDELGAVTKMFSFDHWARLMSAQNLQAIWQTLFGHVAMGDYLAHDGKAFAWKGDALESLRKAGLIQDVQLKDCFGEAIDLATLSTQDPAWSAENFAKVASNARKQAIWTKMLDAAASSGGITYKDGYAWEAGLLERLARADATFAKAIRRPEGGTYDLSEMAKETPAFGAANVAKITSLSRRQALYTAIAGCLKKDGLAAVASFDAKAGAWTYRAGLLAELVKGGHLPETHSKDTAGQAFDLDAIAREDVQFAASRFVQTVLRQAASGIDGAICRTFHKAKNALPEGDAIALAVEAESLTKAAATDPWGTMYRLTAVKQGVATTLSCGLLARKFTVTSAGPDGKFETADDVNAGAMQIAQGYRASYAGCVFFQQDANIRYFRASSGGDEEDDLDMPNQHGFRKDLQEKLQQQGGGGGRWGGKGGMPPAPGRPMDERARGENAAKEAPAMKADLKKAEDKNRDPGTADGAEAGEEGGGGAPTRVREYFPETLLWKPIVITDGEGRAELRFQMADSITTWRLNVAASTVDGRLGSATTGVLAFQDFFIDIDLPVALTQNDAVSIPVAVYNYLKEKQTVELVIEKNEWFELRDDEKKTVEIGAGEVKVAYYRIRALKLGAANSITVNAKGSKMSDAVKRSVEVVPDGQAVEFAFNGQLSGTAKHTLNVPAGSIDGATKMLFKAYPGVFASVMDGLEGLMRMPGG